MTTPDFQTLGEELRQRYGIDGTAGDAQDVPHPFHASTAGFCLVCGLAESYRKHRADAGGREHQAEEMP